MARYRDSVCRLCRREGAKLMLKGERCHTDKCAIERRAYPPGEHGQRRMRFSEYGMQLREKQKVRRIYGVLEKQFRLYFKEADRRKGITGENLLSLLEQRLDNMVYRSGLAGSRAEARQMVRHRHFTVNGVRCDIPSRMCKPGDEIEVRERSKKQTVFAARKEALAPHGTAGWIELDRNALKFTVKSLPQRDEIDMPINEQLIVELYSK